MTVNTGNSSRSRLLWAVLVLLVLVSLVFVVAPVWIIQPFKGQTQSGLYSSFFLRRWSPYATVITLIAGGAIVVWVWRNSKRWWRKALLVVAMLPLLAATWFARQNHFEWMFNPLEQPAYAHTNETDFLNDGDIVLAVVNANDAVAYPVRFMAYHHLVHDTIGGKPIVATY